MEPVVLQSFLCAACGWQFAAIVQTRCPRCEKVMQPLPGTRRKKICSHEDPAQCRIGCFGTAEESEGGRKKVAA